MASKQSKIPLNRQIWLITPRGDPWGRRLSRTPLVWLWSTIYGVLKLRWQQRVPERHMERRNKSKPCISSLISSSHTNSNICLPRVVKHLSRKPAASGGSQERFSFWKEEPVPYPCHANLISGLRAPVCAGSLSQPLTCLSTAERFCLIAQVWDGDLDESSTRL